MAGRNFDDRGSVYRSRAFEPIIQRLGGPTSEDGADRVFETLRDALTFCAFLGFREGTRLPLDSQAGTEDIQAIVYQNNPNGVDAVFALAVAEVKDTNVLKVDREPEMRKVYEEYANKGLEIVSLWLRGNPDISTQDALIRGLNSIGIAPKAESEGFKAPEF